ncbi:unnamed protein product [Symbiodinium natans]|uniref:Uncharacterized protein n=1 Tax=Symbiodinium natans TaxID=878477 RepID=A0A812K492_9DINO|nr:unnamed protein product [Symbiodinium natans]
MAIFDEMCEGFRLVGHGTKSGLFRPGVRLASMSESELMESARRLRPQLLSKVMQEKQDDFSEELHETTMREASEKGWLEGPFSPADMDKRFGNWLPVRRFAVAQKGKIRAIDDFKENLLNNAYTAVEKVVLSAMDHLLWSLQVYLRYLLHRGEVRLELSSGEILSGRVHPSWVAKEGSLVATALDLRSAYKQLPLSPRDHDKTVVVIRNQGQPACFVMHTLPFGAAASVDKFLRISAFIQAAGCELSLLWTNYFDDFPLASNQTTSSSCIAAAKTFLTLMGFEYASDTLEPFSQTCEVLGVRIDLTRAEQGFIEVCNKPSRVQEVLHLLDGALGSHRLVPASVPTFVGKLQYADSQVCGRAGKIALGDLRVMGGSGRYPVNLSQEQVDALKVLKLRFTRGKPIRLSSSEPSMPHVIFTDGVLEAGIASIGGVFYPTCREMPAEVFGGTLPEELLGLLKGDKEHVIGAVELYAVAVALHLWMPRLAGSKVLVFVDNWPALDTFVKGSSSVPEWRKVLLCIERAASRRCGSSLDDGQSFAPAELLPHARLCQTVTYASCQGLTLRGRVWLCDVENPHLSVKHLYVGVSRATGAELLSVI